MPVEAFGHTDVGRARKTNEDDYLYRRLDQPPDLGSPPLHLAAVADGIGGHLGGEIASALAIRVLRESLCRALEAPDKARDYRQILKACFEQVNREIFRQASQDERLLGMGSTMVAVLIKEGKALVANVGDCRAYIYHDGSLAQITHDHNWKEEQLRAKNIPEAQILQSPLRNLVTRSLGFEAEVEVDTFEVEMLDRDYLLLCSDGLYKPLAERKIAKAFGGKKAPEAICRRLIRKAVRKGGQDNITAVVLHLRAAGNGKAEEASLSDTVKLSVPTGQWKKGDGPHD
jgi:protein phosphatase